jgi:DNA-binding CsgD family transcriptional regulator
MLAEKAQELDSLRGKRAELRTELDAIGHRITQLVAELVREIRDGQQASPREQQIVALVRSNKTDKEIAAVLNIATRTVKFHVSRLLKKYAAQSRHDL